MKHLKALLIILSISLIGELCSFLIPLPIPASIYGIFLLFLGLMTKIVPYEKVRETGHFLVELMPILLIPAAVGLLDAWELVRSSWLIYLLIIVLSTWIVMAVVGRVTQRIIRHKGGNLENE